MPESTQKRPSTSAMRAYGLTVLVSGLLWLGQGLLLAGLLILIFLFSGLGNRGQGASSSPPAIDPNLLCAAFLVAGAFAVVWGGWMLFARHTTWVRVVVASVFLAIMILFAATVSPVWLAPWVLVGVSCVAFVSWMILDYQERLPGSPWLDEVQPLSEAKEVPPQPNKKIAKMVETLKGGLDRKTDSDVESWH